MSDVYVQEYLTSNEYAAYPFKEDAEGLLPKHDSPIHGAEAFLPRDFLLDMVILLPFSMQDQVYLKRITESAGHYTMIFGSATLDLFNWTVTSIPVERSMLAFRSSTSRITARLVTGPSFQSYLAGIVPDSVDEFQLRLPIETAVVEFTPNKLHEIGPSPDYADDELVLYEGYNVTLSGVQEQSGASITITAGSGLGAGKHNPCDDIQPVGYIGRINGSKADSSGALILKSDECFRILPDPVSNRLQLVNDCLPCCTCEAYASVVAALKKLFQSLPGFDETANEVNNHTTYWNTTLFPKLFGIRLDAYLTKGNSGGLFTDPNPKTSSGKSPNFGSIIAIVKNYGKARAVTLTVEIPESAEVMQSVLFESSGQHVTGTDTVFSRSMPANSYLKAIVLIKMPYPMEPSGGSVLVRTTESPLSTNDGEIVTDLTEVVDDPGHPPWSPPITHWVITTDAGSYSCAQGETPLVIVGQTLPVGTRLAAGSLITKDLS